MPAAGYELAVPWQCSSRPVVILGSTDRQKNTGDTKKEKKSSSEAAKERLKTLMLKTNVVPLLPSRRQLFLMSGESLRAIDFRAMLGTALKEKGPIPMRRIIKN